MNPIEIQRFINDRVKRFCPRLNAIFKELLTEHPHRKISCIFQRNPSLVRASAQMFNLAGIKEDPDDVTISISLLAIVGPNADFDGDQMNLKLILDDMEHEAFSRLKPHLSVLDTNSPYTVSGNLAIQKPIMAMVANYVHGGF